MSDEMTPADMRAKAARLLSAADEADSGKQFTEADLKKMTADQIVEARHRGQLDDLLAGGVA